MSREPIILYCGDPHGQCGHSLAAASDLRASAVIVLGDLEPTRPLHDELGVIASKLWFIHGNHDTDSDRSWDHLWRSTLAGRNIDGRVVELSPGLLVAGLGGVFRESVWNPSLPTEPRYRNRADHLRATPGSQRWRGGGERRHWSSIYPDEFDRLADLRAEVLVTYEASCYHHHGFAIIDALAQSLGASVLVHGHHHDRLDSSACWKGQGLRSHGVGLRGITAIDRDGNAQVVPGELDEQVTGRRPS